jgi:hypothetical protein
MKDKEAKARPNKPISIGESDRPSVLSDLTIGKVSFKEGEAFPTSIVIESLVHGKTYYQRYYIDRRERGVRS